MDSTITAVAAVAAIASALFVWIQVREMQRQTALQREIREAAEQPYVYADVNISNPMASCSSSSSATQGQPSPPTSASK